MDKKRALTGKKKRGRELKDEKNRRDSRARGRKRSSVNRRKVARRG